MINDLITLHKLVLILLIFNAYLKIIKLYILSLSIIQYVIAMKKAMSEIQKCIIF